jgi:hypothetical protein
VLLGHRGDLRGAEGHGALDDGPRIVDYEQHADRTPAEGLGAEVAMRRGLVGDPEEGVADRKLGHHLLVVVGRPSGRR